jgi:hypothetical protein
VQHAWREITNAYKILARKCEEKRLRSTPRSKWEDNIKRVKIQDLRMWISFIQVKVRVIISVAMNLWVPCKKEDLLTSWVTVSFSRRTLLDGVSLKA